MKNSNDKEMICSNCGSSDIIQWDFDYGTAQIIYRCEYCDNEATEDEF